MTGEGPTDRSVVMVLMTGVAMHSPRHTVPADLIAWQCEGLAELTK